MPNKYIKPGLRSTEDQNGGHGVILCDVGPEDQGLPGRVRLKFDFLGLHARTYLQPHTAMGFSAMFVFQLDNTKR